MIKDKMLANMKLPLALKIAEATFLPGSFFKLPQLSCHSPPTEIPKAIGNLIINYQQLLTSKSSAITWSLLFLTSPILKFRMLCYGHPLSSNNKSTQITPNLNLFSFLHPEPHI